MATIVCSSLLAGCGAGTDTKSDSTSDTEKSDSAEKTSSDGDDQTLTVWAWDQSFNIYAMKEAEKIYQKDHPDFKLNIVETPWDDMQTQLGTIVGSGNYSQLPDICLMQDFAFQKYVF